MSTRQSDGLPLCMLEIITWISRFSSYAKGPIITMKWYHLSTSCTTQSLMDYVTQFMYGGTRLLMKFPQARAQGYFINPVEHISCAHKMREETIIELDCMSIRKTEKFGKPKPKFPKFVQRQTDEDIENLGSVFVLIMVAFLIFVHYMAEYERSLDLDYDADTCSSSCN